MQRAMKREREEETELDKILQTIQIILAGGLSQDNIHFITEAAVNADELSKSAQDMIAAIKLEIPGAIMKQSAPLVFMQEMLSCMLGKSVLDAMLALLVKIDCEYGETLKNPSYVSKDEYAKIYYHLLKIISEQYADIDQLQQVDAERKLAENQQARREADKLLRKLGCNQFTRDALLKKYEANLFQLNLLNGDYNAVMIKAVKDQPLKKSLIEKIIHTGPEAKTKRQRFDLCPPKYSETVLSWLKANMSDLEYLNFTLEGVQDDLLVLETINENRELFNRGTDVADCCKVIPAHLCLDVLGNLLDEDCDAAYVTEALGGVSPDLAADFLLEYSPAITTMDEDAYYELIRMSDEGSELERVLFQLIDHFDPRAIIYMLGRLEDRFNVDYIISCLMLMSEESVKLYISHRQTVFVGASVNSLRNLFTKLLVSNYAQHRVDESIINEIAIVVGRHELYYAEDNDPCLEDFDENLNLYLSKLPDFLKIAIMYGIYNAFTGIGDYSLVYYLTTSHLDLFIRAKYDVIASDFPLEEIMNLCYRRVKPAKVLSCYNGSFEASDISLLQKLIHQRKVTKSAARYCIRRCFKNYTKAVPEFVLNEKSNTLLILLHRYARYEFRQYVRSNFMNMVERSGGYMQAVALFPPEVRLGVLLCATRVCLVGDLNRLNDLALFPANYNQQRAAYLKRVLSCTAKSHLAFAYMEAVCAVDRHAYLEYCSRIRDMRRQTLASYLNVTNNNAMRVDIMCALARHINIPMYRKAVNSILVLTKPELLQLRQAKLQPGVLRLVQSQLKDIELTSDLLNARQRDDQVLLSNQIELQVLPENPVYAWFFTRISTADSIIKSMLDLLETERFGFIMQVAKIYPDLLINESNSRTTKIKSMIALLPMPYQRLFAEQIASLFNTNAQLEQVALAIASYQERMTFIQNTKIPATVSVAQFGAFRSRRDFATAAEPPNKQSRTNRK